MRQSFEAFLKDKCKQEDWNDEFWVWLGIQHSSNFIRFAEEWSSQQPDDEVEVWCGCGDKLSKRSDGFYWCLGCDHGVEILAKRKESSK